MKTFQAVRSFISSQTGFSNYLWQTVKTQFILKSTWRDVSLTPVELITVSSIGSFSSLVDSNAGMFRAVLHKWWVATKKRTNIYENFPHHLLLMSKASSTLYNILVQIHIVVEANQNDTDAKMDRMQGIASFLKTSNSNKILFNFIKYMLVCSRYCGLYDTLGQTPLQEPIPHFFYLMFLLLFRMSWAFFFFKFALQMKKVKLHSVKILNNK